MKSDSRKRFSDRVSDYTRYRPSYPHDALDWIFSKNPLRESSRVADIGAGTGIFTELLINNGATVVAVEPNTRMREESNNRLGHHGRYQSINGSAESTGLDDKSIDVVTAAQAFHWFAIEETKTEFERILKPNGKIVLIWNRRDDTASEFLQHYEKLLVTKIPEYGKVNHKDISDDTIEKFLGQKTTTANFANHQHFDFDGLKGRLLSSSYCPKPSQRGHAELMTELQKLYEHFANANGVRFDYLTQVYLA